MNPKKLVFDYYDSLINKIDVHTEQLLEKFPNTDTIEFKPRKTKREICNYIQKYKTYGIESYNDPYPYEYYKSSDFPIPNSTRLNYGVVKTWDCLNSTREEMIEKLQECQAETLRKLEQVKHDVAKINDEEIPHEEKVEKLFSLIFVERFPIIVEIINVWSVCETRRLPFKLFLIELDFFIRKSQITCLYHSFYRRIEISCIHFGFETHKQSSIDTIRYEFTKNEFRIYALGSYLCQYLNQVEPFVNTLVVKQSVFFALERIYVLYSNSNSVCFNLVENNKKDEDEPILQLKSLRLDRSIVKRLSAFGCLEYLTIRCCNLSETSFVGLTRLKKLKLKNCIMYRLTSESFQDLLSLEILCITNPKLNSTIDFNLLEKLKCLQVLSFGQASNHSNLVVLEANYFIKSSLICEFFAILEQKHVNLEVINLNSSELDSFDVKWLKNFVNLKRLFLNDSGLKKFENLNNSNDHFQLDNFVELDLSKNKEIQLSTASFENFHQLEDLDLSYCDIKSLPSGIFAHLTSLKCLNLSENQINSIDDLNLINLNRLERLDLCVNQITRFPIGVFASLTSLKYLKLSRNRIKSIDLSKPQVTSQIEQLDISINEITSLSKNDFSYFLKLSELKIDFNKIESIDRDTFSGLENLTILKLNSNKLTKLADKTFASLSNLEMLYLENNELVELNENTFEGLAKLMLLNLQSNRIESIEPEVFSHLKNATCVLLDYMKGSNDLKEKFILFNSQDILKFGSRVYL